MNVLLAEYTVHHDPVLAPEGAAMLKTLKESFERIGYTVLSPEYCREFGDEIKRLGKKCSEGLVIAPDVCLPRYTKILEDNCRNIGCNSFSVAICANKQRTTEILSSHGIDVPKTVTTGKRVIKEIKGCGAVGLRYVDEDPKPGEFSQEYLEGDHLSVSMIGPRVVGETCLYYTGQKPLVLALNRQNIMFANDGSIKYLGGMTPVNHPREEEIFEAAKNAVSYLGCQGYIGVDFVVADDRIVVVDINPRPTTSIVGIARCMKEEISQVMLDASYGKNPEQIHLQGHAIFSADGMVQYDRN